MKRGVREFEEDFFGFVEDATAKIRKVREHAEKGHSNSDTDLAESAARAIASARSKFLEEVERAVASVESEAAKETTRVGMTMFSLRDLYDTCLVLYNQQNKALAELQGMVLELGVNPYPKRDAWRERTEARDDEREGKEGCEDKEDDESEDRNEVNEGQQGSKQLLEDAADEKNDAMKVEEEEEEGKVAEERNKEQKEGEDQSLCSSSCRNNDNNDNRKEQGHPHKRSVSLADFGISKETQMAILANKKSGDSASWFYEPKERRSTHSGRDSLSSESVLSRADSVLDASRRLTASTTYTPNASEPAKASKSFFIPGSNTTNNDNKNGNPMNGGGGLFPICRINKFKTK